MEIGFISAAFVAAVLFIGCALPLWRENRIGRRKRKLETPPPEKSLDDLLRELRRTDFEAYFNYRFSKTNNSTQNNIMQYMKLDRQILMDIIDHAESKGLLKRLLSVVFDHILIECIRKVGKDTYIYRTCRETRFCEDILNGMYDIVLKNHLRDYELDKIGKKLIYEKCRNGFRFTQKEIEDYTSYKGIECPSVPYYDFNSLFATANMVWSDHVTGRKRIGFAGECNPTEYDIVSKCVTEATRLLTEEDTSFSVRGHFGLDDNSADANPTCSRPTA